MSLICLWNQQLPTVWSLYQHWASFRQLSMQPLNGLNLTNPQKWNNDWLQGARYLLSGYNQGIEPDFVTWVHSLHRQWPYNLLERHHDRKETPFIWELRHKKNMFNTPRVRSEQIPNWGANPDNRKNKSGSWPYVLGAMAPGIALDPLRFLEKCSTVMYYEQVMFYRCSICI